MNKVAILTAGGRGMGAAAARVLAGKGWKVALMSPSDSAVKLAGELGGIGMSGSVGKGPDLEKLVEMTMSAYGRIDGVFNGCGHPPKGPLLEIADEKWHEGMDMILLSVIRMARLVTPIMQRQKAGAFVNISTYATFEPEPIFPVSCVHRAGLAAFAKLYADQYAIDGIRMNNLLPGFIDSLPEYPELTARIPMKRQGKVAEIGETVAFLLSEGAGYITGQNIRVDGGIARSV